MPLWLSFLLSALAVWRITHLLTREDGPWKLIARLRRRLGESFWGQLMDCFKCLSMWVAIPFVFFVGGHWIEKIVAWLALSGVAILLEEQTTGPLILEGGASDELLRGEQTADTENAEDAASRYEG